MASLLARPRAQKQVKTEETIERKLFGIKRNKQLIMKTLPYIGPCYHHITMTQILTGDDSACLSAPVLSKPLCAEEAVLYYLVI